MVRPLNLQTPSTEKRLQLYPFHLSTIAEPPLLGPGSSFPFVTPEFHQSSENWKQPAATPHTGIIKEAPIGGPTSGRNTAVNFAQQGGGQAQGAVMMVYGLDGNISNTEKLFNLVCLYGNVARVSGDLKVIAKIEEDSWRTTDGLLKWMTHFFLSADR